VKIHKNDLGIETINTTTCGKYIGAAKSIEYSGRNDELEKPGVKEIIS
jgi:hypothetical protein